MSGEHFGAATVRDTRTVARDVRLIEIVPEAGVAPYPTGSHLDLAVTLQGLPDVRSYSLVGAGPVDGAYRIAVKAVAESRGGSRFMHGLRAGDTLAVSRPRSHFELSHGRPEYLLVAGGIGITPMVGMTAELVRAGADFRLLYAGRTGELMPFVDELAEAGRRRAGAVRLRRAAAAGPGRRDGPPGSGRRDVPVRPGGPARARHGVLARARAPAGAAAVRDLRVGRAVRRRAVHGAGQRARRPRGGRGSHPDDARLAARRRRGHDVGLPARRVRSVRRQRAGGRGRAGSPGRVPQRPRTRRGRPDRDLCLARGRRAGHGGHRASAPTPPGP